MALTDTGLAAIVARLDSWVRFGSPAPAEGDVTALVTEVRLMRRVHRTDLDLLNQCRGELARVYADFRTITDELAVGDGESEAS
jgi:hypothetical protein